MMIRDICCCTILYWLLSLVLIFPPDEAMASGLTIEAIFGSWLGSETMDFIGYHIRRTVVTSISHALLLPGYLLTIQWFFPSISEYIYESYQPLSFEGAIIVSLLPLIITLCYVWRWSRNNWSNHPVARELSKYSENNAADNWRGKAAQVNIEFRRIDKFSTMLNSVARIVATDTWLIKVTPYWLHLFPIRDAILVLESSQDVPSTTEISNGGQILTLRASSIKEGVVPYKFRIGSLNWTELDRKLANPIVNTKQIAIHKSLADRFYPEFEKAISSNPVLNTEVEPENCIGCMARPANIKLVRRCMEADSSSSCRKCSCRPMWCLSCLSTWFAARQNQQETETWLSSTAPCPTCRSAFCLLDVCIIGTRVE